MKPDKVITLLLSISLFVLLPFIYSLRLQDVELMPRFLFMEGIASASSLACLIFLVVKNSTVKKDKLYLLFSLFIIINLVSFIRSINFGDGLFEFLKLLLLYTLFFQFILLFSIDEKNKLIFFKAIGISALIFIAFGGIQLYPSMSEFISKGKALNINYSISSTLGNKNFFSETLLLMLPITLLSILYHSTFWRTFFIISSTLIFIAIVFLQTLSTWAALLASAIVFAILLFRFHKQLFTNPKTYKYFYMGAAGLLVAVALSGFIFVQLAGTSQIKTRFAAVQNLLNPAATSPDSLNQNSTYERISLWKNSIKIIADHPVAGVGLGNWKIISPAYGIGSAKYMTTGVIRFTHPHNDFLLIASESGLIGLIVFLSILILLLYYSWSISARATNSSTVFLGFAMILGLTSYSVISFFSLPSSRMYPPILFLFFAALIVTEYLRSENSVKCFGRKSMTLILILTLTTSLVSAFIGNIRLKAEFELSAALLQERKKNFDVMKRHLEKIDKKYYPLDATATPIAWYHGYSCFYLGDREKAFALFKEAVKSNPNHLMVLNDLGTSYNLRGDATTAVRYYKEALRIQPEFGNALINLAIIYFNAGDLESAYSTLIKHNGVMKGESLAVFSTIILAKAETLTKDEAKLENLRERMKKLAPLKELLKEIKSQKGDLSAILND